MRLFLMKVMATRVKLFISTHSLHEPPQIQVVNLLHNRFPEKSAILNTSIYPPLNCCNNFHLSLTILVGSFCKVN